MELINELCASFVKMEAYRAKMTRWLCLSVISALLVVSAACGFAIWRLTSVEYVAQSVVVDSDGGNACYIGGDNNLSKGGENERKGSDNCEERH